MPQSKSRFLASFKILQLFQTFLTVTTMSQYVTSTEESTTVQVYEFHQKKRDL